MSRPAISSRELSPTLTVSEYPATSEHKQGFWLYDETRGMNLALGEPTIEGALVAALSYYQNRLSYVEAEYKRLDEMVTHFIKQVNPDTEDEA